MDDAATKSDIDRAIAAHMAAHHDAIDTEAGSPPYPAERESALAALHEAQANRRADMAAAIRHVADMVDGGAALSLAIVQRDFGEGAVRMLPVLKQFLTAYAIRVEAEGLGGEPCPGCNGTGMERYESGASMTF